SSRRRHTRLVSDWSSDVCSSDLGVLFLPGKKVGARRRLAEVRILERLLRARGYSAVRSSVHVNYWPPGFDKLTACRRVAADVLGDRKSVVEGKGVGVGGRGRGGG